MHCACNKDENLVGHGWGGGAGGGGGRNISMNSLEPALPEPGVESWATLGSLDVS